MTDPAIADAPADVLPLESAPLVPAEGQPHTPSAGATDPILAMIERASRDPSVDIEKFERLMTMKDKVQAERASLAFAEAFADLQPDLPTIDRSGTIVVFSKSDREKPGGVPDGARPIQQTPYATLDDIIEALRKPLHTHGFSIRFEYDTTAEGKLATTAFLRHRSGHQISARTPPLQHDSTGSKNPTQAVGSALTYGRRYALMAVLPIVSHAREDADDDGRAAGSELMLISIDEIAFIEQQLRDSGGDLKQLLAKVRAASLEEMTVSQYRKALEAIEQRKRELKKRQRETTPP